MTDIHTHILPGIDDGAWDMTDTVEMAALASEYGTTSIVATPHCNIPGEYENYFGESYLKLFQETKKIVESEQPEITLLPGMEVFTTEEVPRLLEEGKLLTLNHSRYLLMEFDFGEDPDFATEMLMAVRDTGAIPVVAHVERYGFVQDFPEIVHDWKQAGCEIQVNKGSFMGRFGRRACQTAFELLNHNLITAAASDAHSPVRRTTCMSDAYDYLLEGYGQDYLDILFDTNPQRICRGQKPVQFRYIPFED